jgi:endonuclease/exonuclease/phosphatase family metal-dependent hydrolase
LPRTLFVMLQNTKVLIKKAVKRFIGSPKHAKQKGSIRIVSFNVHFAKYPLAIAEAITFHTTLNQADVFLLQEVESHPHEGKGRAEVLAEALGMECVYVPARFERGNATHGLAVLTKLTVLEVEAIPLPFFRLALRSRPRIAVRVVLKTRYGKVQIYNVHLDTTINVKQRVEQMQAVIQHAANASNVATVVAGDLNTLPMRFIARTVPIFFSAQKKHIATLMTKHGYTSRKIKGYTMKQGLVRFNLDAIYVSGMKITRSGVERRVHVSDHMPIWVDIVGK